MKRIVIPIVLVAYIAVVLATGLYLLSGNRLIFSEGFSHYGQTKKTAYIVEQSKNSSVMYKGSVKTGDIKYVYDYSFKDYHQKLVDFDLKDSIYALVSLPGGYKVIKFDNTLKPVKESDLMAFSEQHDFMRITVINGHAYITGILPGNMAAVVYDYILSDLYDPKDKEENQDQLEAELLGPFYRLESPEGLLNNAYYDGTTIIFNAEEKHYQLQHAKDYSGKMSVSLDKSIRINRFFFTFMLILLIAGILVILLISNTLDKKKRYLNQIIIWELVILAGVVASILVTNTLLVPILWGVGASIVSIIVIMYEHRDMKITCDNMTRVSEGIYKVEKPWSKTDEMQLLWRGMNEVGYQYEKYRYLKDGSFATALKFLPNKLERVFLKKSLGEVKTGDSNSIFGTMMYVATRERMDDSLIGELEDFELVTNGIMMMGNCEATNARILFPEGVKGVVARGMNIEDIFLNDQMTILYFDDSFDFNISGTRTKSVLSVNSDFTPIMERLGGWLFDKGVRMVVTGSVKERDEVKAPTRHIGFLEFEGNRQELYEVLDVYNEGTRFNRLKCMADFDEALGLFYKQNFYLARTTFSDILKIDETDEISRWYLFMCEQYLNDSGVEKVYAFTPQR